MDDKDFLEDRPNTPRPHGRPRATSNASVHSIKSHETFSDVSDARNELSHALPESQALSPDLSFDRLLERPIRYLPTRPGDDVTGADLLMGEEADSVRKGLKDLNEQLLNELPDQAVGYGAYFMKEPIYCHPDSDLPCKADGLNEAVLLVIAALDAGVGNNPTDLVYRVLNAASWSRLTMAILAAIIRGSLRSPTNSIISTGKTKLNFLVDSYPIHASLTRPTTEGGAIICMAEQLAGHYDQKRNRVVANACDHIWDKYKATAEKIAINRLHALAQPSNNTINATTEKARADLYTDTYNSMKANAELRSTLEDEVRMEMFHVLNKEAFENIEQWRESYRTEMVAAMRMEIANPTARAPPTNSQILRNSEEAIRDEVNKRLALIKEQTTANELEEWKGEYLRSEKLEFLDNEAAKLGDGIVRIADSIDRQGRPPKKANIGEKRTRSGSRSSRAPSPASLTPPRAHPMDLEKTPTPTPTKGKRTRGYQGARDTGRTASPTPLTSLLPALPPVLDFPVSAMPGEVTLTNPIPEQIMEDDFPIQLSQPRIPALDYPVEHNLRSRPPHNMEDTLQRLTEPLHAANTTDEPVPMERDYHGDLENRAFEIHGRLPGVNASMHAPQNRAASEATSAPPARPTSTSTPTPTPSVALPDDATKDIHPSLLALFTCLQTTMNTSFNTIFARLDNQDKSIIELAKPKDPRRKAPGRVAGTSIPNPPSNPVSNGETTNVTTQGVVPVPLGRPAPPPVPRNTRPQTLLPPTAQAPTWNKIATQGNYGANQHIVQFAKQTSTATGRTTAGKRQTGKQGPEPPSNITQVTVVRGKGLRDDAKEAAVYGTPPEVIVQAARSQVERIAQNSITLLHGRWSVNPNSHNFVYTISGNVPYAHIYAFRNALVGPLLTGNLVPNKGWAYAQLRGVITSDADGVIFPPETLLTELRRNAAFSNTIFCTAPHWQGNLANVANSPTSTVVMAYVDEGGNQTEAAKRGGIYMFNAQVRFVPTGDHPTIIQCGRCHEVGHHTDTPACPLPANAIRCHICGGSHSGKDHSFYCQGPHRTAGRCDCRPKCLLCKGTHNARSRVCPVRGGFQPPDLATVSTTSKPSTTAKGKPKADDEDTTGTQRDDGFTKVGPKRLSKPAQKARKRRNAATKAAADVAAANAKVPGYTPAHISPAPEEPAPDSTDHSNIIFYDDPRLASLEETTAAFKALFPETLASTEDNLRRTNMEWGGSSDDPMLCNLISLPARFAVKRGLPLTAHLTKAAMREGLSDMDATNYIENMTTACGLQFPLQYAMDHLGPNERFATAEDPHPKAAMNQRVSDATWVKALLVNAEVLLAQGMIPSPLTEQRAELIVKVAGSRLELDNANDFIMEDFQHKNDPLYADKLAASAPRHPSTL